MRATVRHLHSPDVDLDAFEPEDPENVGILIQIIAGPADGPGEESFDVVVCTPRWLERWVRESGPVVGRHHLIVERFAATTIAHYLLTAVEAEEAPTWRELASRIGRLGKWEFEDYQPTRSPDVDR
jgi:hypothetical protein